MSDVISKPMQIFSLIISLQLLISCSSAENTKAVRNTCQSTYDTLTNQIVYTIVDEMPEYSGGTKEVLKFFADNFKYPKQEVFQGSFQLEFIVDSGGNVIGQRIMNKSTSELTEADKEALRILSIMPKWKPGKCEDKTVPVRVYLPIKL
jgi:hypothetical protein